MRARLLPPCRSAFLAQRALPASVLGPVECRHGACRRMRSAWRARRSGDQPALVRRASRFSKHLVIRSNSRLQQSARRDFFRLEEALDVSKDLAKRPGSAPGAPTDSDRAAFTSISTAPE